MVWTGERVLVWGIASGGHYPNRVGVGATWRPGSKTWTPMSASPQRPAERFEGSDGSESLAVDLATGDVVVRALEIGGAMDGTGVPTYRYDPDTDRWSTTSLDIAGFQPPLDAADGKVFVPDPRRPLAGTLPP